MNTKKLLVVILFIMTLLVGSLAIYLTLTLNGKKNEPTITPTPAISVTPTDEAIPSGTSTPVTSTPKASITVTPTGSVTPAASVSCGSSCAVDSCKTGSSCLNVNGLKRCVSDSCFTAGNPPVMNTACNSDLCTLKDNIEISKTATLRCQGTSMTRLMSISIKITNPTGNVKERTNLKVVDALGNPSLIKYYNSGSSNNGGKASTTDNTVLWEGQKLAPNGASQELHYTMSLPNSENGKSYNNTVSVYEDGVLKGSTTFIVIVDMLPCTALSTNDSIIIISGAVLILLGMLSFRLGWNTKIGNFFWNHGLDKATSTTKNVFDVMRLFEMGLHHRIIKQTLSPAERFETDLLEKENSTKPEKS